MSTLSSQRKLRQALRFHQEVAPRLLQRGARVPPLLDHAGPHLLCAWQAGAPDPGVAAHRAAGRWLRVLHDLEGVPADPMPLDQAVARRIAALCPQLPAPWDRLVAELDLSVLARTRRVWCHRDLHPRNWLWDGARLVMLDFEHTAPDLSALDWVRVPERAALLEGYGGLSHQEEAELFVAGVLGAAGTLAWGLRHEDPERVFTGQQRLRAWIPIG